MSSMQILLLIALAPAFGLLVFVYKKDKLEKEPKKFILRLVLLGAASTTLAMITETIGELIFSKIYYSGSMEYLIIENFIVVALSEEGFKFLMLKVHTWKNKNYDCQYDGVVYAVAVSLGFAALENVLYVYEYGLGTGILRAVTAVPGHASFAVLMGAFYGLAKKYNNDGEKGIGFLFNVLAVLVPAFAHGAYDFLATIDETTAFLVFIIALFAVCFVLVQVISNKDHYFAGMEPALEPAYDPYSGASQASTPFAQPLNYEQLPYARPVGGAQPQSAQPAQPAPQVMNFCHNCGAKNTGNKFCMNCGQILVK